MTRTWLEDYLDTWNRKDAAAVAEWIAEDCVYEDVAMGEVLKGPTEVMAFAQRTATMSSDYAFEVVSASESGEQYTVEWVLAGTHTGDMPGIPATGKPFRIRGVSVGRRNAAGKITEDRDYWNMADFLMQIGVLPPPE
jgi:steroid delta-isomerase-like uncharacterized protein